MHSPREGGGEVSIIFLSVTRNACASSRNDKASICIKSILNLVKLAVLIKYLHTYWKYFFN